MTSLPPRIADSLLPGAVAGTGAYLLGLVGLFSAEALGFGVQPRNADGAAYLVFHAGSHLPVWGGSLHLSVVPFTLSIWLLLLVAGATTVGFAGAGTASGFRVGGAIVVGYFPPMVIAAALATLSLEALTPVQMVAPTVLAGAFAPLVFGGVGGRLADRVL